MPVTRVSLRPVTPVDLAVIERWAGVMGEFMARTRPYAESADRHAPASGLYWYVIVTDGVDVGTVWIERLAREPQSRLGVFLGDHSYFGHGIGREALRLAIAEFRTAYPQAPISLHVRASNERAIACYRAVGFEIVGSDTKVLPSGARVAFHTMILPGQEPSAHTLP